MCLFKVLGLRFILNGKTWWGLSVLAPVAVNIALTFVLWWRFEDREQKKWSWLLVIAQMWPPLKALQIIVMFKQGMERRNHALIMRAEETKLVLQREVTTLEPFVESVPQVLNLCNIWLKTTVIGTSIHKTEVAEDFELLGGSTKWIFYCTLSLSLFTASLGK